MFPKQRFITRGVAEKIPPWLQTFMWLCIDELEIEADYLQVFDLSADGHMLRVSHSQECPPYHKEYLFATTPITAKIFVINDGDYATMLFAEEY